MITLSSNHRVQVFNDFNFETGSFEFNELISNDFYFDEGIHALYGIFRNKWKRLSYQAGLRAELTLTESFQADTDETFVNNYFDLFPSLFLSYEVNQITDLQVNYSRRINRPGVWALNPGINAQDLYNLRIGNPYLMPEYTHSFEVSALKNWNKLFFTATTYYRFTNDVITRVFELFDDNSAIVSFANANKRQDMSLEVVNQYSPLSWLDATFTTNLFRTEIFGDNIETGLNNAANSWSLSLLTNARIPKLFSVQLQGNYRGPIVLPQGQIDPLFGLDVGLRREVLKRKGTISINVSDVFNTRQFIINTEATGFNQRRLFNRETQIATLSFTYRFGGYREKRETRRRGDNGDDMGEDF